MRVKVNTNRTIVNTTKPIRSAINYVRKNSVFADNVCSDLSVSLNAFTSARNKIIKVGKAANVENTGLKKFFSWIGFQGKGMVKGSGAMVKKAGLIPAITAVAGFTSCIPGGTSVGLLLGLILKNACKSSKNLFAKAVLK